MAEDTDWKEVCTIISRQRDQALAMCSNLQIDLELALVKIKKLEEQLKNESESDILNGMDPIAEDQKSQRRKPRNLQ